MYDYKRYWRLKRKHCREKGIDYALSREKETILERTCPTTPGREKGCYHLGRKDHSLPYTDDNVEWQTVEFNVAEPWQRFHRKKKGALYVYLNCSHCNTIFETRGFTYRGRVARGQDKFYCSLECSRKIK